MQTNQVTILDWIELAVSTVGMLVNTAASLVMIVCGLIAAVITGALSIGGLLVVLFLLMLIFS